MDIQVIAPGLMVSVQVSSSTTIRELKETQDLHPEMQASCNGIRLKDEDTLPDDAVRVVFAAGSKSNR